MTDERDATPAKAPTRPALRIVRGDPSAEEVAALTAIMAATSDEDAPAPRERRGGWNDPGSIHRPPGVRGPNGWRAAYAPR